MARRQEKVGGERPATVHGQPRRARAAAAAAGAA
eukprot:COSAG01_NODE_6966_length_3413_cov_7.056427_1_plen_33_part_10